MICAATYNVTINGKIYVVGIEPVVPYTAVRAAQCTAPVMAPWVTSQRIAHLPPR